MFEKFRINTYLISSQSCPKLQIRLGGDNNKITLKI